MGIPKPRVTLILQARMGSVRLPGKSMMDLAGAPLVGRILERVKRCKSVDKIVLATTQKTEDDILKTLATTYQVQCFQGSENDLVDRYYQAAKEYNTDVIVRLPADNPVPEPSEIDKIIQYHLKGQSDFSSNLAQVYGNGYPDGIGAEVFNFKALEEVWKNCRDLYKREHPHLNFFNYKTQEAVSPYRIGTVQCPSAFRRVDLVLDVNTWDQYLFMKALYEYLYPHNAHFNIVDIIQWYDEVFMKEPV